IYTFSLSKPRLLFCGIKHLFRSIKSVPRHRKKALSIIFLTKKLYFHMNVVPVGVCASAIAFL
ncbi:hypothetical protein Q6247_25610, partial [Klebsiella pneumoniae]